MKIKPMGDRSVIVYFEEKISEEVSKKVHTLREKIKEKRIKGVYSLVPGYSTLTIHYDPLVIPYEIILDKLKDIDIDLGTIYHRDTKVVKIPVLYGDEWGIDLSYVAKYNNISEDDVIKIHSGKEYLVYMLGFAPGFTYLGELDQRIATPRLESPRLKVPAGSVGIAGRQTGIYAVSTPGGWRIIGRTPYKFFTPYRKPYTLLKSGDRVKFYPISRREFEELSQKEKIEEKEVKIEGKEIFEVKSPGPFTIVVDKGRYGYEDIGLSPGGPMDDVSYKLSNKLIGNPEDAPSLEVVMGGLVLNVKKETMVSFVGGDFDIFINNTKVNVNDKYLVRSGDTIKIKNSKRGIRLYISIPGGINVPYVMGSASTDVKAGIGGIDGRPLKSGDILYGKVSSDTDLGYIIKDFQAFEEPILLRTIPGPNLENFKKEDIELFYNSIYRITNHADRMGYRLEGPKVGHSSKGAGIISEGVVPGAIQVPGEGYPIVMMKDAQPLGGYAKIGTIISPDLRKLGQAYPGCKIRFIPISIEDVPAILEEEKRWMEKLDYIGRKYRIKINDIDYNVEVEELK